MHIPKLRDRALCGALPLTFRPPSSQPFAKYTRNGLNLEFEFSPKLNTLQLNSMLRLSRTYVGAHKACFKSPTQSVTSNLTIDCRNMTKILEESGDEWSKAAMRNEMQEPGAYVL